MHLDKQEGATPVSPRTKRGKPARSEPHTKAIIDTRRPRTFEQYVYQRLVRKFARAFGELIVFEDRMGIRSWQRSSHDLASIIEDMRKAREGQ